MFVLSLLSMQPWAAEKISKLVWLCHQLLSGLIVNGHLARVSRLSPMSANDKGDQMIPVAVHKSPGIYLTENPGKPQLGYRWWWRCDQSPPQMRPLTSKWGWWDRIARQEGRRKEKSKGRAKACLSSIVFMFLSMIWAINHLSRWPAGLQELKAVSPFILSKEQQSH